MATTDMRLLAKRSRPMYFINCKNKIVESSVRKINGEVFNNLWLNPNGKGNCKIRTYLKIFLPLITMLREERLSSMGKRNVCFFSKSYLFSLIFRFVFHSICILPFKSLLCFMQFFIPSFLFPMFLSISFVPFSSSPFYLIFLLFCQSQSAYLFSLLSFQICLFFLSFSVIVWYAKIIV